MAENKALNEEALVEMAHTMGFDLAHACAAAADAFARGVADGFAAYAQELAAENGGVELVHDEEDEEPELKTDIQDCRRSGATHAADWKNAKSTATAHSRTACARFRVSGA